jgi:cobalt-zinc-cadmium efflux system membrane fusion protein
MAADRVEPRPLPRGLPTVVQAGIVLALFGALAVLLFVGYARSANEAPPAKTPPARAKGFVPSAAQLQTFTIQPAAQHLFQLEHVTEGKIGVDEDRATPVFSPYSGRVIRLLAKQGDMVQKGQVLFTIEATDMVQAQNDLIAASGAVAKTKSQLQLAQTVEKRQKDLYEAKAVSLREWQNAQNDLVTAQNDTRAANAALEAVRNRLTILGRSEAEMHAFVVSGRMSAETPIQAPIAGTITQRRVGPGQFITNSASEPPFVVGDLSSVWLLAQVRESEAPRIANGQAVRFGVLAYPDRTFSARVAYVASAIDPATRRIQVRAVVDNRDGLLKPEMFASVRIATGVEQSGVAVPKESVIYEGNTARLWVLDEDGSVSLKQVKTGLVDGPLIQITDGVAAGEKVVTRGSLFIDRLASTESN